MYDGGMAMRDFRKYFDGARNAGAIYIRYIYAASLIRRAIICW